MQVIGAELYLKETKYRHLRQFPKPKSLTRFLGMLRTYAKSVRKNGFWREDPIAYQATLNVQELMNLWEDKYLFKPKDYYYIRVYYNSRVVERTLPETEVTFYDNLLKYFKEGALCMELHSLKTGAKKFQLRFPQEMNISRG